MTTVGGIPESPLPFPFHRARERDRRPLKIRLSRHCDPLFEAVEDCSVLEEVISNVSRWLVARLERKSLTKTWKIRLGSHPLIEMLTAMTQTEAIKQERICHKYFYKLPSAEVEKYSQDPR